MSWFDDNEDWIILRFRYPRRPRARKESKTHHVEGCGVMVRLVHSKEAVTCQSCHRVFDENISTNIQLFRED